MNTYASNPILTFFGVSLVVAAPSVAFGFSEWGYALAIGIIFSAVGYMMTFAFVEITGARLRNRLRKDPFVVARKSLDRWGKANDDWGVALDDWKASLENMDRILKEQAIKVDRMVVLLEQENALLDGDTHCDTKKVSVT